MTKKNERLYLRITPELKEQLEHYANEIGRSVTEVVTASIERTINYGSLKSFSHRKLESYGHLKAYMPRSKMRPAQSKRTPGKGHQGAKKTIKKQ